MYEQALGCDEAAQMEAHRSCVNGLLAFHRYRDGDIAPGGIVNHSFQHVTDVASRSVSVLCYMYEVLHYMYNVI